VECLHAVDANLAPDGVLLINLIDVFSEGGFLGAMVATIGEVFPNVAVLTIGAPVSRDPDTRRTFVLAGWKGDLDLTGVEREAGGPVPVTRLTPAELADLRARESRVLTDDWAPVENLLAPVVASSSREISANLLVARAREALREEDSARARHHLERALSLDEDLVSAHELAAFIALREGDAAGSIPHFRAILAERPGEIRARIDLATALARTGHVDQAIGELEEAVRQDPSNAVVWRNLGILRRAAGDTAGAAEATQRANELEKARGR
jgi:Flp pilus assembly protein TadD